MFSWFSNVLLVFVVEACFLDLVDDGTVNGSRSRGDLGFGGYVAIGNCDLGDRVDGHTSIVIDAEAFHKREG